MAQQNRPAIPAELKRRVLTEAGHRCAIPACRHPTTEIHHIVPWADIREHSFDNLIALCPNCHSRATSGEIDRKSIKIYKRNLGVVTGRYCDLEVRLLETMARSESETIGLNRPFSFEFQNLIADGLVLEIGPSEGEVLFFGVPQGPRTYQLTEPGKEFLANWIEGRDV